jgi:tetratricopeptide (TPR) repeat protein
LPNPITNVQTRWLRIILACVLLLNIESLAQGPKSRSGGAPSLGQRLRSDAATYIRSQNSDPNSQDQDPPGYAQLSHQAANQAISIARLHVPRKARELCEKARKHFLKHEYPQAQEKLNQALQLYPAYPEALTMSGFIQLNTNQLSSAELTLQAAVKSDPTFALAFLLLGELYSRELRFDDALSVSQHAFQLVPNDWTTQYQFCRALIGTHQYAAALRVSEAGLRANRGTLLHIARAHALFGLGRNTEAATELRTYLQYQPTGEGAEDAHDLLAKIQSPAQR